MAFQTLGLSPPPETRSNILESPAVPLSSPAAWGLWNGWGESSAGELVNDRTMMHSSTVNACVSLLSSSIASMSPILYQRQGAGRSEAFNNPLHDILALEPNEDSTAFTLWHGFMSSILLTGNGFLEVQRDDKGTPVSVWYRDPRQVQIIRQADGSLAYRTSEAMTTGTTRTIKAANCVHVPWHLSYDGVTGISALTQARQTDWNQSRNG